MHRSHVAIVSVLLATAVVLGAVAVTRTAGLGAAERHANDAAVAAKTKQLAAYEAKLRQALAARPPALPPLPKTSGSGTSPATGASGQKVIYRRPPPVVVVKHTSHGDDGFEQAAGGGDD